MGKLFCIMGKSSTGKDTIYRELCSRDELKLKKLIMYTTRPIRAGEEQGKEYFFVDDARADELESQGKIIEMRCYHTMYGDWKYFMVDDGNMDLDKSDYICLGTLESYGKIKKYYGEDRVIPIYIEVDPANRLERALKRERKPQNQKYEEMCRRFLADNRDYSEENLEKAGIGRRFSNDNDRQECMDEVAGFIRGFQEGKGVAE